MQGIIFSSYDVISIEFDLFWLLKII